MPSLKMNLANKITIVRALLIPFFIILVIYYSSTGLGVLRLLAIAIFLASALTDAVDGYIARVRRQRTRLGTFLDPMADKLLLISAFVTLSMAKGFPIIPIWVPIVVISRDVIIVLGLVIIHMVAGSVKIAPNMLGKVNTFFQMVAIAFVLFKVPFSGPIWITIWGLVALFTIASGVGYIIRDSRYLNEKGGQYKRC